MRAATPAKWRTARTRKGFVAPVALVLALLVAASAHAKLTLTPAFTGSVSQPMYVTAPPGDPHRLFIVTRPGVIYVAVDGVLQTTPFLDISSRVWSAPHTEAGMASMAFDPGYENPASPGYGLIYVYFVAPPATGDIAGPIHLEEFKADPASTPDVADPTTARLVLNIPHSQSAFHYGGTIQFNPKDGLLYIGTGDAEDGPALSDGNAQNTKKSLLGKVLRIDPHVSGSDSYSIPDGNPFKGQLLCNPPSGTTDCPEILAWGLRNPFRWSFDRATGDIAIGDVGQDQTEEVDYVPASAMLAGDNFGWPCYEGAVQVFYWASGCSIDTRVDPVWTNSHADPSLGPAVAITGGLVVRDPGLGPLVGRYLYADYFAGAINSVELHTPTATDGRVETDLPAVPHLVSFGEDAGGHVYVVQLQEGTVQRIVCDDCSPGAGTGTSPPPGGSASGSSDSGVGAGSTTTSATPSQQKTSSAQSRDTTPPRLSVRRARVQDVLRGGNVRLSIECAEACVVRASAKARGLALRAVTRHLQARKSVVLELRAGARVRRALKSHGVVTITLRVGDTAHNIRTVSLTVRVKRR